MKIIFVFLVATITIVNAIDQNETGNPIDETENATRTDSSPLPLPMKPFVYYGRYHPRRARQAPQFDENLLFDPQMISTLLASFPVERLAPMMKQLMTTMSLRDIFQPQVANTIEQIMSNPLPTLLKLFMSNNFPAPSRVSMANITVSINAISNRSAPNGTATPSLLQYLRRPKKR